MRFSARPTADLAALLREELRDVVDRLRGAEAARRRARFRRPAAARARSARPCTRRVREAFQSRFTHLFVDEFQDTDPLQAEILLLLAADDPAERDWRRVTPVPGKLFIVGDPKQAIYRFRRADVETYREVCELLEARGARRAFLHTSFRATPAIQRAVNAAFAPLMTGDRATLQARVRPLCSPYRADRPDSRRSSCCRCPSRTGSGASPATRSRNRCRTPSARSCTGCVTESGWTVTERTARDELPMPVPIEPRHVCILFRRFLHFGAGRDAAVRRRARSARRPAPARRRQVVPRPRGGGNDSRGARRHRVARRRAVGVRDAARRALRDRRRDAARVPPPSSGRSIRSGCPTSVPPELAAGGRRAAICCGACTAAATIVRSPTRSRSC